jgi:hypothetical protein
VENGGTITAINEYGYDVPFTVEYKEKKNILSAEEIEEKLESKVDKTNITQGLGDREDKVLSQKAITDTLRSERNALTINPRNNDGFYNDLGEWVTNPILVNPDDTDWGSTGFIDVKNSVSITTTNIGYITAFDENKHFIEYVGDSAERTETHIIKPNYKFINMAVRLDWEKTAIILDENYVKYDCKRQNSPI